MPDGKSIGDFAQIRAIAEQVGESAAQIAISNFVSQHPEVRRGTVVSEIPAPLKWGAGIVGGLLTAGAVALAIWLFSSVQDMTVTLARMDERMANYTDSQSARIDAVEKRVDALENYHRSGGR